MSMRGSCERFESLAAELALGLLSGGERAEALEHLVSCPSCRLHLEELARVADAMMLLAPAAEPPVGFETRVLDRIAPAGRSSEPARRWWRWLVPGVAVGAAGAAVIAGALAVAGVALRHPAKPGPELERDYVAALRTLGGTSLRATRLLGADGRDAGEVFVYQGEPSWVFVEVHDAAASAGSYRVELLSDQSVLATIDGLAVGGGSGSLGRALLVDTGDVTGVAVLGPDGMVRFQARLPHHA